MSLYLTEVHHDLDPLAADLINVRQRPRFLGLALPISPGAATAMMEQPAEEFRQEAPTIS
jgi:hypothetical protein